MPRTSMSKVKNSLSHRISSSRGRKSSGRSGKRSSSSRRSSSSLSSWLPLTLGVAGVCGLVYGLMQITVVSDFMEPVISDVGEFFGLTSDEGIDSMNITHDRTYSSALS